MTDPATNIFIDFCDS